MIPRQTWYTIQRFLRFRGFWVLSLTAHVVYCRATLPHMIVMAPSDEAELFHMVSKDPCEIETLHPFFKRVLPLL